MEKTFGRYHFLFILEFNYILINWDKKVNSESIKRSPDLVLGVKELISSWGNDFEQRPKGVKQMKRGRVFRQEGIAHTGPQIGGTRRVCGTEKSLSKYINYFSSKDMILMVSEIYSNICTSSERHHLFSLLGSTHCGFSGGPEKPDIGLGRSNYSSCKTRLNESSLCVCSLRRIWQSWMIRLCHLWF